MQKEVRVLMRKGKELWSKANTSQRFTAVVGGLALLLIATAGPLRSHSPRFVCDNGGRAVIGGGSGNNSTAESIARTYCTGDIELAVKVMIERHGNEKLFGGSIIRLPVDKR